MMTDEQLNTIYNTLDRVYSNGLHNTDAANAWDLAQDLYNALIDEREQRRTEHKNTKRLISNKRRKIHEQQIEISHKDKHIDLQYKIIDSLSKRLERLTGVPYSEFSSSPNPNKD